MAGTQGVGCSVMSVTQSSFTARRWNFRFTRSSAVATPLRRVMGAGPGSPSIPAQVIRTETSRLEQGIFMPMVSSA